MNFPGYLMHQMHWNLLFLKELLNFITEKHHRVYVNNLNNLIEGTSFENADLVDIILKSDGGIFNNAA